MLIRAAYFGFSPRPSIKQTSSVLFSVLSESIRQAIDSTALHRAVSPTDRHNGSSGLSLGNRSLCQSTKGWHWTLTLDTKSTELIKLLRAQASSTAKQLTSTDAS